MKVTTGRSQARHVADDTGIAGLYIVENEPLERLLFNRNHLGSDFRAVCLASVRGLVSHVADELTKDDYSELPPRCGWPNSDRKVSNTEPFPLCVSSWGSVPGRH